MLFSKPKKAIGLDIGTHSVKAVQMSRSGGRLCVDEVGYAILDRNQVNADPITAQANAISEALRTMPLAQSFLVAALPGQTVVIRYPRLPETAPEQMVQVVEREAGQNIPYDLSEVFLDWTLLDHVEEGDQKQLKVLLVAARHEVIDSRVQILDAAEVQCSALGVDSLALADAAEGCDFLRVGETVALVHIGLTSASIHFVKDGISNFIRDVSWGARELIQAIAKDNRCEYEEAERLLQNADKEAEAPEEAEELPEATPIAEEVSEAPAASADVFGEDPFGEMGGGSLLDPLEEEIDSAPSAAASSAPGMGLDQHGAPDVRETLAGPLARMVSEIRRSFDFYEHQLYERPVNRLIISGGVAHLGIIAEVLQEELGVESVEIANPCQSALFLGDEFATAELREQPAQFMVAIGLAARGMADL